MVDPRLPGDDLEGNSACLPVSTNVFRVRLRGGRKTWGFPWRLVGGETAVAVPALGRFGIRPGAVGFVRVAGPRNPRGSWPARMRSCPAQDRSGGFYWTLIHNPTTMVSEIVPNQLFVFARGALDSLEKLVRSSIEHWALTPGPSPSAVGEGRKCFWRRSPVSGFLGLGVFVDCVELTNL